MSVHTAVSWFLNNMFDTNGCLKSDIPKSFAIQLARNNVVRRDKADLLCLTPEEVEAAVLANPNPVFARMFVATMRNGGLDTIQSRMWEIKPNKTIEFDPLANRAGENRGTVIQVVFDGQIRFEFVAGNGSMHNIVEHGHTFLMNAMLQNATFNVVHKMDGRYVGIYIIKLVIGEETITFATIHSRKGVLVANGILLEGSVETASRFSVAWLLERFRGKEKIVNTFVTNVVPIGLVKSLSAPVHGVMTELVSANELTSAFDIVSKMSADVPPNSIMCISCEGTKDNMRPYIDQHIARLSVGLYPHPFSTVVARIMANGTVEKWRHIADPTIFTAKGIACCKDIAPHDGSEKWNIDNLLAMCEIGASGLYNLVEHTGRQMATAMSLDITGVQHPVEGAIIVAITADKMFLIKVKDMQFADAEELNMRLEAWK